MKREENSPPVTLEEVLTGENLNGAWAKVKANAGAAGVDGLSVAQTGALIAERRVELIAKLLAGRYVPEAVKAVDIPKASGGTRRLGIPTVLDRLIQQAIHQKLSPLWEPEFSEHSYGFRPKRSAHDAVRAAQAYVKAGRSWVVDLDLKSFFDRVGHDKLMHLIGQKLRDKRLLRLIGDYLRAPMQTPDGREQPRSVGTPQGGPL
jgi:RNA-directed DNA polymerase